MLWILLVAGALIMYFGMLEMSDRITLAGSIPMVILIIVIVNIPNIPICYYEEEKISTYELVNNSMFYYSDDNGGYKVGGIDLENTIIYEDDNCTTPYVEKCVRRIKATKFGFILMFITNFSETKNYEIHVPAGTMKEFISTESQT